MAVEEVFTITGLGTVFAGKVVTGSIAAGDRIVCRTPSADIAVRVISVQDVSGRAIKRGDPGSTIGVVCKTLDLPSFATPPDASGIIRPAGTRLISAPEKQHWWQ